MNVTVLLICSLQKNIGSGSKSKKKKKGLPTYSTVKVRVGERGNKHFFNCGLKEIYSWKVVIIRHC
jgi:hypothetical protein